MWTIIGGLVLEAFGFGLIMLGLEARTGIGAVLFPVLGAGVMLTGLYVILRGFKSFFLADILAELKRIAGPQQTSK